MIRKITILLSGTLAAKLLQFVYFFLAARIVSKEQFGIYAILMTLFLIGLFPVLEWGSELIITRNSATHDHMAFKTAMFWKWISFPFIFTALGLYAIFQWNYPFPLVFVAGLLLLSRSIEQSFFAYTRGLGENKTEAIHLGISRTISLSLLLSSHFFLTLSAFWVFTFQVVGSAVSLVIIHYFKLEIFTFARPKKEELIHLLKEGAPLALTAISWLVFFKVDTLMIGRMLGENEAGYYELGYKFLEASFLLPGVMMAILYRHLSMSVQSPAFKPHVLKSFAVLFTGGMIVMIAGKVIVPLIFPVFFREDQQIVPVLFQTL
ncbi:oligosaccharide flippase family protein, partial [bacterium]|nr:oligosaccharide flippase family protein [bacterium]